MDNLLGILEMRLLTLLILASPLGMDTVTKLQVEQRGIIKTIVKLHERASMAEAKIEILEALR